MDPRSHSTSRTRIDGSKKKVDLDISSEYRKLDESLKAYERSKVEEEKLLRVIKGSRSPVRHSPARRGPTSKQISTARFEEFMTKLRRDKEDFYRKLESKAGRDSPDSGKRENPYIPKDQKVLDASIEQIINKRLGVVKTDFQDF